MGAVNIPYGTFGRDGTGNGIVEDVGGVDDFEVAEATYRAAVARWPAARKLCDRASGWCMLRRCTGMGAKPRAPRLAGLGFVMVPLVCRRRQCSCLAASCLVPRIRSAAWRHARDNPTQAPSAPQPRLAQKTHWQVQCIVRPVLCSRSKSTWFFGSMAAATLKVPP